MILLPARPYELHSAMMSRTQAADRVGINHALDGGPAVCCIGASSNRPVAHPGRLLAALIIGPFSLTFRKLLGNLIKIG
jgi:hypothetical protein